MKNKLNSVVTWLINDPAHIRLLLLTLVCVFLLVAILAPGLVMADNMPLGGGH